MGAICLNPRKTRRATWDFRTLLAWRWKYPPQPSCSKGGNRYPPDKSLPSAKPYPLDSDLSGGYIRLNNRGLDNILDTEFLIFQSYSLYVFKWNARKKSVFYLC